MLRLSSYPLASPSSSHSSSSSSFFASFSSPTSSISPFSFSSSSFFASFSSPTSSFSPFSFSSSLFAFFSSPTSSISPFSSSSSSSFSPSFLLVGYLFFFLLVICPIDARFVEDDLARGSGVDLMSDLKVSPPCADAAEIFPCRCSNTSAGIVTLSCDGVTEASVARRALRATGYGANPLGAFHLRWGTVTSIEADFFGERSFEEVLLHNNHLETVEAGSLEILKPYLVTLNANNNRLTEPLITQLSGFTKLTSFGQSGNLLTSLTHMVEMADTLPSVRSLELADNLIGSLPARAFQCVPEVRTIDLSYNNISYIHPDAFLGLTQVDQLLLEGNNLNHLGSPEVGRIILPREVGLLSLKDCSIQVLEPGFVEGLGDRSSLKLSRNPMLHFPEEVFGDVLRSLTVSDIPERTGIDFYYNFIECDCDFLWLAKDRWLIVHVYGGFCAPRSDDWKDWVGLYSVDADELEKNCSAINTPEPPGPLRF